MKTLFKNALVYIEGEFVSIPVLVEDAKIVSFSEPCCSFEDIETVDLGVPVLSMHAPFEIIGKIDLYNAHLAFKEFFKA